MSDKLKVVFFGDSITGPYPRQPYLHLYVKYVDMVGIMLEARLGIGRVEVINRGWAGDTAVEAKHRLQGDVLDERPDIVIVLLGGNDAARFGPRQPETRAALVQIFSGLHDARVKTLALQYHVLVDPNAPDTAWHHLKANNGLIADAATSFNVPLLDLGPVMNEAQGRLPLEELVETADGVHLHPAGELVFARTIFAKLVELGWV
jgi:lysophospholipase L1-like esterase